jgi:hypothetical protein
MNSRNALFKLISMGALILGIYFVADRMIFLSHAKKTMGTVQNITTSNGRCGGKHKYNCTKFLATVNFDTEKSERIAFVVSAGSSRGYDRPIAEANLQVGTTVRVLYDPNRPDNAYRDDFFTLWGRALITGLFGIPFFSTRRKIDIASSTSSSLRLP